MDLSPFKPRRIRLMGQSVDLVTSEEVMRYLGRRVIDGRRTVIANHNAHSLYQLERHPEMRAFYERADLIEVDSMPLVLWGKLMGEPIERAHRCTYLSWREMFWALADRRGWRVFYLGGEPGVAERGAVKLRAQAPRASIRTRDGYFDMAPGSAENAAVLAEINAFRPHVLFIGMGMPRQEIWIERNYEALVPTVMLPVGAAFDYEAGVQKAAPRWTGMLGIEWAFRFAADPARLFERYFVEPWSLIPAALADVAERIAPAPQGRLAPILMPHQRPYR